MESNNLVKMGKAQHSNSQMDANFVELNKVESNKLPKLSIWMFIIISLRSYFLQSGFNYANFQGLGYAYVLYPALRKLYGQNSQELRESLERNIEFFNSNPQTLPFITSIHLTLLQNGQTPDDASLIKMSLMGPLSGIGDSVSQFAIYPLFSVIASGMAENGEIMGPIIFIIGINVTLITIKLALGLLGYRLGERAISQLTNVMQIVIQVAGMVGIMVIVALSLRMTKVVLGLEFSNIVTGADGQPIENIISIQKILDNIAPFILTSGWIFFVYKMVTKYQWNPIRVIGVTIVVGLILGVFGILTV